MDRIRRFMYGRYGADQLGFALLILGCLVSFIISLFGFRRANGWLLLVFKAVAMIPYIVFLLRMFSKNIQKRREENEKFLRLWAPYSAFFSKKASQFRDKEHKYYNCPGCSRTLRVPKGKGKIEISCPHCGRKFKKRT